MKLPKSKDPVTGITYNLIIVIVDRFTKYLIVVLFKETHTAEQLGHLLLDRLACNNSNLHVVQAGNLGAVDGGQLPRLLVVAAPRANQVTGQAAGVAERQATGGVAQAPWTPL